MRVQLGEVVRRDVQVQVSEDEEHGVVVGWVTLPGRDVGLDGEGGAVIDADVLQRRVGHVELRNPGGELGLDNVGGGHIAVVGANDLTGGVPLQEDLAARVRKRNAAVLADGSVAVKRLVGGVDAQLVLGDALGGQRVGVVALGLVPDSGAVDAGGVGLVQDVQGGEVLPDEAGLVVGAARDVRRQQSPGPALGNTDGVPLGHGELTTELAEDELLAGLNGDTLQEQLSSRAGVEVGQEAVDTGLTPAGKLLVEVDKLGHVVYGVVVRALLGGLRAEHVGENGSMADLLVSHVLEEEAILRVDAISVELLVGERSQTPVEQVKLNPLLVQGKGQRLVVEVTLNAVDWSRAVGADTTARGVRSGLVAVELTIGRVVVGIGSRREGGDGRGQHGGAQGTGGGGIRACVRAVRGNIVHLDGSGRDGGFGAECGVRLGGEWDGISAVDEGEKPSTAQQRHGSDDSFRCVDLPVSSLVVGLFQ